MDAGVPMAPTIFAIKGKRSPAQLMAQIKERGWKTFVMKQSESGFSLGFCKFTVDECEKDPSILATYFKDWSHCPEFIVQEAIEGFTRNWETRCFWFNGKFLYAIANMAAVSAKDSKERIVTGNDIPKEFLENAKRIGQQAIKVLPELQTGGAPVKNVLVRTDVGCSDSQLHVEKAREIYKAMKREQIRKVPAPARSTPVKGKAKPLASTPVKAKTKPAVSAKVLKTGKLK